MKSAVDQLKEAYQNRFVRPRAFWFWDIAIPTPVANRRLAERTCKVSQYRGAQAARKGVFH